MLKITHKRTYFAFQESQISIYILFDFCLSKYLIFQTTCSDWLLDIFCANYTIYFYAFQDGKILNSGSIRVKSFFPPTIKLFPRSKLLWSIEKNIIWDIDEFKKTQNQIFSPKQIKIMLIKNIYEGNIFFADPRLIVFLLDFTLISGADSEEKLKTNNLLLRIVH